MSARTSSLWDDPLARLRGPLGQIADVAAQLERLAIPDDIQQLVGVAESGLDNLAGSSIEQDDSCLQSARQNAARLRAALLPLSGDAPGVSDDLAGEATEPGMVLEALHLLMVFGADYPLDILLDLAASAAEGVKYAPGDVDGAVRVATGALEYRLGGASLDVVSDLTRDLHSRWGRPKRGGPDGHPGTDYRPADAQATVVGEVPYITTPVGDRPDSGQKTLDQT